MLKYNGLRPFFIYDLDKRFDIFRCDDGMIVNIMMQNITFFGQRNRGNLLVRFFDFFNWGRWLTPQPTAR